MNLTYQAQSNDKFNKYFAMAIGFHGLLIALGLILNTVLNLQIFRVQENPKNLELIQSSVRVDVVAMPKFTVQELKKMKVSPPVEEPKGEIEEKKEVKDVIKKDDIVIEKPKKKINLKNLLSNLSKKEKKTKRKGKTKGKINSKTKNALRSLILEGNKVSQGTSAVGDSLKVDNTVFNNYVASLPNFVRPHWKLPSYLIEKDLKCRIRVYIAANGKILNSSIYESSGVEEFDKKALQALSKVGSMPKPDGTIIPRLVAGEVVLGFPL